MSTFDKFIYALIAILVVCLSFKAMGAIMSIVMTVLLIGSGVYIIKKVFWDDDERG